MSDKELKPELPGERLGALLLMLGVPPLVLVLTSLAKGAPEPGMEPKGMSAVAQHVVRALGYLPSILLYGSMSLLGGVLFLGYTVRNTGRHLLGMVGITLGVATMASAVQIEAGGVLGDILGGSIAKGMGATVGIIIGLVIVTATVVVAYLDGKIPMPKKLGTGATLSTALTELDDSGVSNAESSALAADASTLAYMEELWKGPAETIQVHPIPPSPYPEDVRLKGEVPKGASPLPTAAAAPETEDVQEETESDEAVSQVGTGEGVSHRWERPKAKSSAELGADSDLGADPIEDADAASADDPFRSTVPVESLSQADLEPVDCKLPVPELPPGVRPLVVDEVQPVDVEARMDSPVSPVWERAKTDPAPLVEEIDESEELDIVMDLPEVDAPAELPEVSAAEPEALPKLNFESLEFEAEEQASAPAETHPETGSSPIWESSEADAQSTEPVSSAADPFAGDLSEQDQVEALAELSEAEEAVLEQIDDLEDELEREMEKIRNLEAKTEGLMAGGAFADSTEVEASMEVSEPAPIEEATAQISEEESEVEEMEFVVVDGPGLFGEAEESTEDEETPEETLEVAEDEEEEYEEEEEEAELEEGEEYEEEEGELEEGEEYEEEEEEGELEEGEEYEYEEEEESEEEEPAAAELEEEEYEEEEEEEAELEEGEEYEEEEEEAELEEGELEEGEEYEYEEEEEAEEEPAAAELEEEEEEEDAELEEGEEYEEEEEEEYEEAAELEDGEEGDGEEEEEEEYEEYEYEEFEEEEEAEEAELEDPEEEEETVEASDEEPEVELQPAPQSRRKVGRDSKWSHGDLVREAGAFLIERDRVGVSLLQRQFELEFEDAQALLDEFEEAGLIEPYMGGQKRAILLDLEAWLERSTSS